jgi:hypothetical protein
MMRARSSFRAWGPIVGHAVGTGALLVASACAVAAIAFVLNALGLVELWDANGQARFWQRLPLEPWWAATLLFAIFVTQILYAVAPSRVAVGEDGVVITPALRRPRVHRFAELAEVHTEGGVLRLRDHQGACATVYGRPTRAFQLLDWAARRAFTPNHKPVAPRPDDSMEMLAEIAERWEAFQESARRDEAAHVRIAALAEPGAGEGYRSPALRDEELRDAVASPALPPRLRVAATRELASRDPAAARELVGRVAQCTAEEELERELLDACEVADTDEQGGRLAVRSPKPPF